MSQPLTADILVIGGAHIDRIGRSTAKLEPEQSNPGTLKRSVGGVAGNIARSLSKLDWQVALSTVTGGDADASLLRKQLVQENIDISLFSTNSEMTSATYTAIEDKNGSLIAAIADMSIYDTYPTDQIETCLQTLEKPTLILADTNLAPSALSALAASKGDNTLAICAVSGPKANRASQCLDHTDLLFCNEAEAAILADEFAELDILPNLLMEDGVKAGVITKGDAGLTAWKDGKILQLPAPPVKVKSTNGAGDCLTACILHGLLLDNAFFDALSFGMAGASLALMSEQSVPDLLNRTMLDACLADVPKG